MDSILFAALSHSSSSYLILRTKNGFVQILYNLGSNAKNYLFSDFKLNDNKWHNLTLVQRHSLMDIHVDLKLQYTIQIDDQNPYFYFDPGKFCSAN